MAFLIRVETVEGMKWGVGGGMFVMGRDDGY